MTRSYDEEFILTRTRHLYTDKIQTETTRDPDGRLHGGQYDPAIVKYTEDGKPYHFEHWFRGLESHKFGPSVYTIDPETDVVVYERYMRGGELHRPRAEGFAIIHRDRITGEILDGQYHESDNPLYRSDRDQAPR